MTDVKEVSVQFESKLPFQQPLPDSGFSVPVELTRYGLSEIVNNLSGLEEQECARPFDFVIDGKLLRGDLARYLEQNSDSGERGLTIEVVDAVKKPSTGTAHPHPDWVSAVSTGPENDQFGLVATGCYDTNVRVWKTGSNQKEKDPVVGQGHRSAIRAVEFFSVKDNDNWHLVSGSKDKTARVWKYSNDTLECIGVFCGHTNSIESVATSGTRFATSSWDNSIRIWTFPQREDNNDVEGQTKKRRIGDIKNKKPIFVSSPLAELTGHRGAVSCCVWPVPIALYSGSWDHTIRLWDPKEGKCTQTFQGDTVVTSLDFSKRANMLVSGHHDSVVRIWDPRGKDEAVVKLGLKSHSNWVTGVKWSPLSSHMCASVSHDQTVKLWDIRATIPLHTLTPHHDKVLCIDFSQRAQWLITGGSDGQLCTHKLEL